ncbi:MAG: ATP-binding protein, partial [Candidatus Roizmanbacteria bacterium]|nr:ATP-binding protein [Candidatus Roizmanbacteria bacterium]
MESSKDKIFIKDDGVGMDESDFQEKFLKVGYSKRGNDNSKLQSENKKRPYIGRKGIGKLALLSCAEKITVISRKSEKQEYTGAVIDNKKLDQDIKDDVEATKSVLGNFDLKDFSDYLKNHKKGTLIFLDKLDNGFNRSFETIRKIIAYYFRFSLIDKKFNIYVNDVKITVDDLKDLKAKTQFVWTINGHSEPYIKQKKGFKFFSNIDVSNKNIKGYLATTEKTKDLNIMNLSESVGVDLFVNGRLREKNIIRHIPKLTERIVASYLYGQIHIDTMDAGNDEDRFTSSREGVVSGDEIFENLIKVLDEEIRPTLLKEWDKQRRAGEMDGDIENDSITPRNRKIEEATNFAIKDYKTSNNTLNKWLKNTSQHAQFNFRAYQDCYMSENLLREFIGNKKKVPNKCIKLSDKNSESCIEKSGKNGGKSDENFCPFCKGKKRISSFSELKDFASLSIKIRKNEDDPLSYLDYADLAKIIDNKSIKIDEKTYKPLR